MVPPARPSVAVFDCPCVAPSARVDEKATRCARAKPVLKNARSKMEELIVSLRTPLPRCESVLRSSLAALPLHLVRTRSSRSPRKLGRAPIPNASAPADFARASAPRMARTLRASRRPPPRRAARRNHPALTAGFSAVAGGDAVAPKKNVRTASSSGASAGVVRPSHLTPSTRRAATPDNTQANQALDDHQVRQDRRRRGARADGRAASSSSSSSSDDLQRRVVEKKPPSTLQERGKARLLGSSIYRPAPAAGGAPLGRRVSIHTASIQQRKNVYRKRKGERLGPVRRRRCGRGSAGNAWQPRGWRQPQNPSGPRRSRWPPITSAGPPCSRRSYNGVLEHGICCRARPPAVGGSRCLSESTMSCRCRVSDRPSRGSGGLAISTSSATRALGGSSTPSTDAMCVLAAWAIPWPLGGRRPGAINCISPR